MDGSVVEVALFKLTEGANRAAFLVAAAEATDWLRKRPGFLGRELLEEDGGQWLDLVRWTTLSEAHAAGEEFISAAETRPMVDAIDASTVRMLHPRSAARYD